MEEAPTEARAADQRLWLPTQAEPQAASTSCLQPQLLELSSPELPQPMRQPQQSPSTTPVTPLLQAAARAQGLRSEDAALHRGTHEHQVQAAAAPAASSAARRQAGSEPYPEPLTITTEALEEGEIAAGKIAAAAAVHAHGRTGAGPTDVGALPLREPGEAK